GRVGEHLLRELEIYRPLPKLPVARDDGVELLVPYRELPVERLIREHVRVGQPRLDVGKLGLESGEALQHGNEVTCASRRKRSRRRPDVVAAPRGLGWPGDRPVRV